MTSAPERSPGADDWDSHWSVYNDSAEQNPAQAWRRTLVFRAMNALPGARLIDVGSGQGDFARDLATERPDLDIHGLELSATGVAHASRKVPSASFHQIDLLAACETIGELESSGDVLVCTEVLEHLDDPATLLRHALRYAKPGAQVIVTVPAGPRTAFDRYIGHRRHFTRASLRELLGSVGLQVDSCDGAGFPFFNLYRLVVLARGKRLIQDVAAQAAYGPTNRSAGAALRVFEKLFTVNRSSGRFGWQLIATARVVEEPR